MKIQTFKTLTESILLTEASKKSGYSDEHATKLAWNFLVNHPKAKQLIDAPNADALKAEMRKAIGNKSHSLHPDNVEEGWKGGDKSSVEGYKSEMDSAAEVVHSLAKHPSFKNAVKKKLQMNVAGAEKCELTDAYKMHGCRDNSATATSKADLHIGNPEHGKDFHTISLKKGTAQLFSGQSQETRGLFEHATSEHIKASKMGKGPKFTEADKQEVISKIQKMTQHMDKMKNPDRAVQLKHKAAGSKILDEVLDKHPGLLAHLHFEAATGRGKFKGKGQARHLVSSYTDGTRGAHVHDTKTGYEPIIANRPRLSLPKASSEKPGSRPGAMRLDYKPQPAKKEKSKKKK